MDHVHRHTHTTEGADHSEPTVVEHVRIQLEDDRRSGDVGHIHVYRASSKRQHPVEIPRLLGTEPLA